MDFIAALSRDKPQPVPAAPFVRGEGRASSRADGHCPQNWTCLLKFAHLLSAKKTEVFMALASYTVEGMLENKLLIRLLKPLPLRSGKIKVTINSRNKKVAHRIAKKSLNQILEEIHKRQSARGHQPPTAESVEAYLRQERASWGE
jgi:hypothetical protein